MVSVERQPTTWARVDALGQRLLLAMSTARTILAGVRRIDGDKRATGPCCLVREKRRELRPRRILNAFGEAMIVDHPMHRQIFHGKEITPIDQTAALLVRKVGASVSNPFIHTRHHLPALSACRRTLRGRRQLALRALQVLLVGAQELRTGCPLACRERRETPQAHVNAYGLARRWQWLGFHVTRDRDVPLPRRAPADDARFRCALQGAMLHHAQRANLRQLQHTLDQLTTVAVLRKGHRIIPPIPTEARIPRLGVASFAPPKVRLEGQVNPPRHVLQDVRMHGAECWAVRLQMWQSRLLPIVRQRLLSFLPPTFAFRKEVVVQATAFLQLTLQEVRLLLRGLHSVLHGGKHEVYYSPKPRRAQALFARIEGARRVLLLSPWIHPGGLRRIG